MPFGCVNLTSLFFSVLPLYEGPSVKLQLKPSNKEYTISKRLLCSESPVFSAMFNGEFLESQQQTVTLEETKDDVSIRGLEALCQWLYQRTVKFEIEDTTEHISAAMELTRLANKYDIVGLEAPMAKYIKNLLKFNTYQKDNASSVHYSKPRDVNTNTYYLTHDHIVSVNLLPQRHPVRSVLAAASVEGFLRSATHKFSEEVQTYPSFGVDLLREVRLALNKVERHKNVTFIDPISEEKLVIYSEMY